MCIILHWAKNIWLFLTTNQSTLFACEKMIVYRCHIGWMFKSILASGAWEAEVYRRTICEGCICVHDVHHQFAVTLLLIFGSSVMHRPGYCFWCLPFPPLQIEMLTPKDYIGSIMELTQDRRGEFKEMNFITESRVKLIYELPLAEVWNGAICFAVNWRLKRLVEVIRCIP